MYIDLKKYFFALTLLAFMGACGNSNEKKAEPTTVSAAPANNLSSNPDYQKGLELIAKSDCLTCHKVSEKVTGPAYKDVANKYENTDENVAMLAAKVQKGGTGVWGAIPMVAHPGLSDADAKQMVKYILLLRNK